MRVESTYRKRDARESWSREPECEDAVWGSDCDSFIKDFGCGNLPFAMYSIKECRLKRRASVAIAALARSDRLNVGER